MPAIELVRYPRFACSAGASYAARDLIVLPSFARFDGRITPPANPGTFPEIIPCTSPAYFCVCFAGITASPLESIAGIESEVPDPGPRITPPAAYFLPIGIGGTVVPPLPAIGAPIIGRPAARAAA